MPDKYTGQNPVEGLTLPVRAREPLDTELLGIISKSSDVLTNVRDADLLSITLESSKPI